MKQGSEKGNTDAIKELMLLLRLPENKHLVAVDDDAKQTHQEDLADMVKESEKRFPMGGSEEERKSHQMEYVMSHLLGKMKIPSSEQNYYHNLIDSLSYSAAEWDSFMQLYVYLYDRHYEEVYYTSLAAHDGTPIHGNLDDEDLKVLSMIPNQEKRDEYFELGYLIVNDEEYGTGIAYFLKSVELDHLLRENGWEPNLPKSVQHQIIHRELAQVEYRLYDEAWMENYREHREASIWFEAEQFLIFLDWDEEFQEYNMWGYLPGAEATRANQMKEFLRSFIGSRLFARNPFQFAEI